MLNKQTRQQLLQRINKLSETEHIEIFKMLTSNNVHYTQNNNGVFLNLSNVDESIVHQISEFVEFCIMNKIQLDEYEKKMQDCKRNNHFNVENTKESDEYHFINNNGQRDEIQEKWDQVIELAPNNEKIVSYIDELMCAKEKKKCSTKFNSAKKKYSKRFTDKKGEFDNNILEHDKYIL